MKEIIFEAYEGGNVLHSTDGTIRATVKVPEGASEDYGYLAMKNAILAAYHYAEPLAFWYDGQEQYLEADASDGEPTVEIYCDPTVANEFGKIIDFNSAVTMMDDDIRGRLDYELSPCSEQEFFDAYCKAHAEKLGEEWELAKKNPVW